MAPAVMRGVSTAMEVSDKLKETFADFCPPVSAGETLIVGCGISELPAVMHRVEFKHVLYIDNPVGVGFSRCADEYPDCY